MRPTITYSAFIDFLLRLDRRIFLSSDFILVFRKLKNCWPTERFPDDILIASIKKILDFIEAHENGNRNNWWKKGF